MAIRNAISATGAISVELAERWCDAWEAEAERQEIPRGGGYWDVGRLWIEEQRAERRTP